MMIHRSSFPGTSTPTPVTRSFGSSLPSTASSSTSTTTWRAPSQAASSSAVRSSSTYSGIPSSSKWTLSPAA